MGGYGWSVAGVGRGQEVIDDANVGGAAGDGLGTVGGGGALAAVAALAGFAARVALPQRGR